MDMGKVDLSGSTVNTRMDRLQTTTLPHRNQTLHLNLTRRLDHLRSQNQRHDQTPVLELGRRPGKRPVREKRNVSEPRNLRRRGKRHKRCARKQKRLPKPKPRRKSGSKQEQGRRKPVNEKLESALQGKGWLERRRLVKRTRENEKPGRKLRRRRKHSRLPVRGQVQRKHMRSQPRNRQLENHTRIGLTTRRELQRPQPTNRQHLPYLV